MRQEGQVSNDSEASSAVQHYLDCKGRYIVYLHNESDVSDH